MNHRFLCAAFPVLLALGLAACTAPTPHLDAHIGEAVADMRHAQVMNPAAGQKTAAPTGTEASTAKLSYEQYQKTFKTPERSNNSFVIGIGR